MSTYAAFCLDFHCLPKYLFTLYRMKRVNKEDIGLQVSVQFVCLSVCSSVYPRSQNCYAATVRIRSLHFTSLIIGNTMTQWWNALLEIKRSQVLSLIAGIVFTCVFEQGTLSSLLSTECHPENCPTTTIVDDFFFSYYSTKTYVVGTQKNPLIETVLLSIQNKCKNRWIRK